MPEISRFDLGPNDQLPHLDGVFLGWMQTQPRLQSMMMASREDSVAILGPPRVGKTSGVLIPQAMVWPGSVISASTKPDVLRATRNRRLETALLRGGDVFVYSPTDSRPSIDGVRAIRWSPTDGCEDPTTCEVRVQKMLGPEKPTEQAFFRQSGATIIRGFFHAAALAQCGMRRVKLWIDRMDVNEAVEILMNYRSTSYAAAEYASALEGIGKQAPETKAGSFGTVSEKLAAIIGNAAALNNADQGDFDVDSFLQSGSTLYIVSPEDTQAVIAPLVAGLIESIVSRAYQFAALQHNGRMDPPLLLLLDEVGAIAPLQSLPQIMGQGAGQGVLCVWAAQSFNQLKARWGEEWANSIWGASSQKLVFGGLADTDLLEKISQSFGEYDRRVSPHANSISAIVAALNKQNPTPHLVQTRKLQVSELHGVPPGSTNVIAMTNAGPERYVLDTPPAVQIASFAAYITNPAHDEDPNALRAQIVLDQAYKNLSSKEQDRCRREHIELNEKLSQIERLDSDARRRTLGADPQLRQEADSLKTLMQLAPLDQILMQKEIVDRFETGEIPHFTYTIVRPEKPLTRRGIQRRSPDRY